MSKIENQLDGLYREWGTKLDILKDRTRSFKDRLDALTWINNQIGEKTIPDDLERVTDELIADEG